MKIIFIPNDNDSKALLQVSESGSVTHFSQDHVGTYVIAATENNGKLCIFITSFPYILKFPNYFFLTIINMPYGSRVSIYSCSHIALTASGYFV